MAIIAENLSCIRQKIATTAIKAGRDVENVRLIAVSKTHDIAAVHEARAAGQRVFGENRVQEAKAKFAALKAQRDDIELHLIGPLQTNKVEDAIRLFDVIQTLDRPKLAEALAKAMEKTGCRPRYYIEVNIGHEAQKAGIAPEDLGGFLGWCRSLSLEIDGLMCIPPQQGDAAGYFQRLKTLADDQGLSRLSMGMSGDFEIAIACGATDVRVGTAIFGARSKAEN
jgi:pyridoxal phosphate enzyme (YggS family)